MVGALAVWWGHWLYGGGIGCMVGALAVWWGYIGCMVGALAVWWEHWLYSRLSPPIITDSGDIPIRESWWFFVKLMLFCCHPTACVVYPLIFGLF